MIKDFCWAAVNLKIDLELSDFEVLDVALQVSCCCKTQMTVISSVVFVHTVI
jgi:hypothetical protein